jgi:hypothetical protein
VTFAVPVYDLKCLTFSFSVNEGIKAHAHFLYLDEDIVYVCCRVQANDICDDQGNEGENGNARPTGMKVFKLSLQRLQKPEFVQKVDESSSTGCPRKNATNVFFYITL